MSLPFLVAIVAIGITVTVAAVHFTGGGRRATIADAEQARRTFLLDFPTEQTGEVMVTKDLTSAFLTLQDGRTGIVHSLGDGFLTRVLSAGDVASVEVLEPVTVSMRLHDFTWAGGRFVFTNSDAAYALETRLRPAEGERA